MNSRLLEGGLEWVRKQDTTLWGLLFETLQFRRNKNRLSPAANQSFSPEVDAIWGFQILGEASSWGR